jgi:tetratricopeptide (TPR) repeat protein
MATGKTSTSAAQTVRQLLQKRQFDECLEFLRNHLQREPGDSECQELLGMTLFVTKRYEDAKAAFERLTQMDPMYSAGWVNLGAVQNVLKDYQGATKSLRKAIQRDTKSASAYYNLGIAQKAMKMNSMAISAYREAIKLDPEMEEPHVNLGNIYMEMTNFAQAVKVLETGVERFPNSTKLRAVLRKAKDLKEGNRKKESPFGRLVDEEQLARKQIRTTKRELTATERNEERDFLRVIGKSIRKRTEPLVALLDETLHQQLPAAQKDSRGEAGTAYDKMTATLEELDAARRESSRSMAEIRTHLERTDPGL